MQLDKIEIFRTTLQCHKPFRIATGVSNICRTLVVRITTKSGHVGYGEAVPKPMLTLETWDGCLAAIRQLLWPAVQGLPAWAVVDIHKAMDKCTYAYPSAKAAIDIAVHDILARQCRRPLYAYLGGQRTTVPTNYSIGLASPREIAEDGANLVQAGYKAIKLKVGGSPLEDVARVRSLRQAVGPNVAIRLDANEGWNYCQAVQALRLLEPYDIELIEQPLVRHDIEGMAQLHRQCGIPLFADESVRSREDVVRLLRAQACDGINIKLMKCGGLHRAQEMVAIARASGLALMVGGMVGESVIGVTAAASLAAAHSFEYADLDADLLLKDQLFEKGSLGLANSERTLSTDRDGLGLESPNEQYMEAL